MPFDDPALRPVFFFARCYASAALQTALHDIRNQLTAIRGFADITRGAAHDHAFDRVHTYMESIERAAIAADKIAAGALSRVTEPPGCDVNFYLAARAAELLTSKRCWHIGTALERNLPLAKIGPGEFDRIILNLVENACDAMPAGSGNASIHLRSFACRSGRIVVHVEDSGCGIPPEQLALIRSETAFSSKAADDGEHGLGLARIVWPRLRAAGGSMDIESTPGMGSVFKISLPALAA